MYDDTPGPDSEMKLDELKYSSLILNIDELDISFYPREKEDSERIKLFSELLKEGEVFPEIAVVKSGKDYFILDGVHRYRALKQLKKITVNVRLYKDIPKQNWLLLSAALNLKSSKPLSKEEIRNVVIESYDKNISKSEIGKIIGYSKSTVSRILKPHINKKKRNKREEAIKLNKQGVSSKEIADRLDIHERTFFRWLEAEKDPLANAETILNDMAISHGRTFNKIEKDVFLCLESVKLNHAVDMISKRINQYESWVRSIVLALIYIYYHSSYREVETAQVVEYFDMDEKKVLMIMFLFDFRSNRPERKLLLKWIEENSSKYDDVRSRNLLRNEKLYWHCENKKIPHPWEENNDGSEKIHNEMPQGFIPDIKDSISRLDRIEAIVSKTKYDQKIIVETLELVNELQISLNSVKDSLRRYL